MMSPVHTLARMVNQSIRQQVTKRSVSPSARGGWGQGGPSIVELAIRLLVPSRRAGWGPYSAPTFSMHAASRDNASLDDGFQGRAMVFCGGSARTGPP